MGYGWVVFSLLDAVAGWAHRGLFLSLKDHLPLLYVPITEQATVALGLRDVQNIPWCIVWINLSLRVQQCLSHCDKSQNQSADPVTQGKCHMKLFFIQCQGQRRTTLYWMSQIWKFRGSWAPLWKLHSSINSLDITSACGSCLPLVTPVELSNYWNPQVISFCW